MSPLFGTKLSKFVFAYFNAKVAVCGLCDLYIFFVTFSHLWVSAIMGHI